MTLTFFIALLIAIIILNRIAFRGLMSRVVDAYEDYLLSCSSYIASFPWGDDLIRWAEEGADEYYNMDMELVENYKESYRLQDVCIYYLPSTAGDALENEVIVVYQSDDRHQLGEKISNLKTFSAIQEAIETKEAVVYPETIHLPGKAFTVVGYAPITDYDGKPIAVVAVELSGIYIAAQSIYLVVAATIGFLAFAIIALVIIRFWIVKPINILSKHMNEFVAEEGKLQFTPITEIRTNDEIEQMADDFNALAQRVMYYTRNLEVKTSEEERLRLDLSVAGQIRNIVSSESSYPAFPERTDFDLYASMKHTIYNKCSFYNYFFTDTDRLFIVFGESLGNNLASMIFSVLAVSHIKSFAKMGLMPYQIAAETNNQLCSIDKKDSGLTVGAVIVDIDLKTGEMRYVNVGMPPLLIKRAGENFKLDKTNLPFSLGQMRGLTFEQNTLRLSQGNTILFTSFGVSELCNRYNTKYSLDRLVDQINRISGTTYALNDVITELENDLEQFRGDAPVTMDTAILGFRYFG